MVNVRGVGALDPKDNQMLGQFDLVGRQAAARTGPVS